MKIKKEEGACNTLLLINQTIPERDIFNLAKQKYEKKMDVQQGQASLRPVVLNSCYETNNLFLAVYIY